jgi:hypothetical protein
MYSQHEGQETETSLPLCSVCVSIVRNSLMGLNGQRTKRIKLQLPLGVGHSLSHPEVGFKASCRKGWPAEQMRSWLYPPTILSHQRLCLPWPHGLFKLIINSWSTSWKHTTTSQICSEEEDLGRMNCYWFVWQPCEWSVLISQDFSFYKKIMLYAAYGFRTVCQTA